ncbi:hypothetical protein BH18ACI5_BH18ACI5_06570 [soil metagenome]
MRAIGPDGPVQDLKREELSIKTDGKQREVKSIELVAGAAAAPTVAPAAVPASILPAPFATNAAAATPLAVLGGREFLIVLDEDGIAPGREEPVQKAVAQLMSETSSTDSFGLHSTIFPCALPVTCPAKARA